MASIPDIQKIFDKHQIPKTAQDELKTAFEQMIIRAFYKEVNDPKATKAALPKTEVKEGICPAVFYKGTKKEKPCSFKPKENGFCGRHDPDKVVKTTKIKKKEEHTCNYIIKSTGNYCKSPGTKKPGEAEFHYCGRHFDNWKTSEKPEKIDSEEEGSDLEVENE